MKYLLDSNTLIEAKNRYYAMTICPAYWQWVLMQNKAMEIASISMVANELKKGNDDLAEWTKENPALFVDISDEPTQSAFGRVAQILHEQSAGMKVGALEDFLSGADPWLIAKAWTTGATVVTHEAFNPNSKKKFLIPNICKQLNIPSINTFELLHRLNAKFVLP